MRKTMIRRTVIMETYFSLLLCALSFSGVLAVPVKEGCNKVECQGPIQFYKDLGCEPIFENPEACCPHKYNCDHLKNRKNDKCYANGHEYAKDEFLRDEDAEPCDKGCFCAQRGETSASFVCAIVDCSSNRMQPGCYQIKNANDCCRTTICSEKPEDVPKCEVEGKTYKAGEYFSPSSEPKMDCYCSGGFTGEFKAPWCKVQSRSPCGIELRHSYQINQKCAPVYYDGQSTQTGCPIDYRCQNPKDRILSRKYPASQSDKIEEKTDDMKCHFGDFEMNLSDELNQGTDYSSVCVKCVCDVPPFPTCKKLPTNECNSDEQFAALRTDKTN